MTSTLPVWRQLVLIVAASTILLPLRLVSAQSAQVSPDTVTIEARRARELQRQINQFVYGVATTYMHDSLERWNTPMCPLVAGLPRERGEFVLARVSQIARDSHVPLGTEHCKPNLYIVISDSPDHLLDRWSRRDKRMFNTCNGMGYVNDFMHSRQPIRVYYNAKFSSGNGNRDPSSLDLDGLRFDFAATGGCVAAGSGDTNLSYGAVQQLTSVIIVVDSRRITNINIGQLADYVAMVGLAQVHLSPDTGTAPTILSLFREPEPQIQGLSPWDAAFLQGLYTTSQSSTLQVVMIKRRMFEKISGKPGQ